MNNMWECVECGAKGIVATLDFCPHCFSPRAEKESGEVVEAVPNGSEAGTPSPVTPEAGEAGTESLRGAGDASLKPTRKGKS